jgi:phosphoribosyl 1,2-cyclic phosphate phosphodiesterase
MGLRAIILGCGSSGGVPRVGGDWGSCNPENPKNSRTRSSLYVEYWEGDALPAIEKRTSVLIDTSPDLREQFLSADIQRLDAVLYTHEHADQSHGIDDLRAIAYRMRTQIPTYMDENTKSHVHSRFHYCFEKPQGRVHPPILALQPLMKGGDVIRVAGPGGSLSIDVLQLSHGPTPSLGFIFDKTLAYAPDVWNIPDAALTALEGIDTFIVDSLRYNDHPTHANADKTLSWLARTHARRGILTNLHIDMDYDVLSAELPPISVPAYDGMEITL